MFVRTASEFLAAPKATDEIQRRCGSERRVRGQVGLDDLVPDNVYLR